MKKIIPWGVLLSFAVMAIIGLAQAGAGNSSAIKPASSLPTELDSLYPPITKAPTYYLAMQEMALPFSGMAADILENDFAYALQNYEKFKAQYQRVSGLIAKWKNDFPLEPVDDLGTALKSGEQAKIMGAIEAVGKTCHGCHLQNMALAHYRYHWDDFSDLMPVDPISSANVSYAQFMQMLEGNLAGIAVDLEQAQLDKAQQHGQMFAARFQALKESCEACHETERRYYVDEQITGMIVELQTALAKNPVEPQRIGGLLQGIGQESCYKCHLVHVPAAYAKALQAD